MHLKGLNALEAITQQSCFLAAVRDVIKSPETEDDPPAPDSSLKVSCMQICMFA